MSFWCKALGHRWQGCACKRCGQRRDKGHRFEPVKGKCEEKCALCGKIRVLPCTWHRCACKRCGALRDEQHDWMDTTQCEQVCRVCGQERHFHRWQALDRGIDKCKRCGKLRKLTPEEIARRDEQWSDGFQ